MRLGLPAARVYGTSAIIRPPIQVMPALPPFQGNADGCLIHTTFPPTQTIPDGQDRRFIRADCWGVNVPTLPFVAGANSTPVTMLMSWFLPRYSDQIQNDCLFAHAIRGYTHYLLFAPADRSPGSIAAFVQLCLKVKGWGFWVMVSFGNKNDDLHDMTAPMYAARNDALLDALLEAQAIDHAIVGFELNLWHNPNPGYLDAIIRYLANRCQAADVLLYLHFSTRVTQWGAGPTADATRFWQQFIGLGLTGLLYQGDPSWSHALYQAEISDAIRELGAASTDFDVVAFELVGQAQLYGQVTEETACLLGLTILCTPQGPKAIRGTGNGARFRDGRALYGMAL